MLIRGAYVERRYREGAMDALASGRGAALALHARPNRRDGVVDANPKLPPANAACSLRIMGTSLRLVSGQLTRLDGR